MTWLAGLAVTGIALVLVLLALPSVHAWRAGADERRKVIAGLDGHLVTVSLSIGRTLVIDHEGFIEHPQRDGFTLNIPNGKAQWVPYGQVVRLWQGSREFGPW